MWKKELMGDLERTQGFPEEAQISIASLALGAHTHTSGGNTVCVLGLPGRQGLPMSNGLRLRKRWWICFC